MSNGFNPYEYFGISEDDDSVHTYKVSPIAWSGSNANSAAGDVVFLYKGDM